MLSTKQFLSEFLYMYWWFLPGWYLLVRLQTELCILWSNYVSLASLSMLLLLDRVSSYSQADLKLGTLQMHISSLQLLRVSSLPLPQLRWKLAFQQLLLAFFLKANVRYASFFLFHRGKKLVRKDNQTESFLTWTLWMLTPTHVCMQTWKDDKKPEAEV